MTRSISLLWVSDWAVVKWTSMGVFFTHLHSTIFDLFYQCYGIFWIKKWNRMSMSSALRGSYSWPQCGKCTGQLLLWPYSLPTGKNIIPIRAQHKGGWGWIDGLQACKPFLSYHFLYTGDVRVCQYDNCVLTSNQIFTIQPFIPSGGFRGVSIIIPSSCF